MLVMMSMLVPVNIIDGVRVEWEYYRRNRELS